MIMEWLTEFHKLVAKHIETREHMFDYIAVLFGFFFFGLFWIV